MAADGVIGQRWASARRALVDVVDRGPLRPLVALVVHTVQVCLRYRVTGLAAESGFFALLSLPPLVLGLAGSAAWIGSRLGTDTALQLKNGLREYLSPFLTDDVVNTVIIPTLEDALDSPRLDLVSIGFVLSLWSGSRALNVYLDTISIMYGLGGHRSLVRTRVLSFLLYVLLLALGAVTIPLVLVGPTLLGRALPAPFDPVLVLYWPVVTLLGVALLATLYHVSVPLRTAWRRDLPGALTALVIWVLASALLRAVLGLALPGSGSSTASLSIYGPLTTPIVVLVWLYLVAIAVLIGAAVNAAVDELWPHGERSAARRAAALALTGEVPVVAGTLTPVRDTEAEQAQVAEEAGDRRAGKSA
ncbi:YihY/virulence factor BrkB family protein [Angustibacter speluncae]